MKGYEKRVYFCSYCGEFEVDTEKYSQCKCEKNDIIVIYDNGHNFKKLCVEEKYFDFELYDGKTVKRSFESLEKYTYPFFKMNEFQQKVYAKIKTSCIVGKYEAFETLFDCSKQLGYFSFSLNGQMHNTMYAVTNEISCTYMLTSMEECDSKKLTKSLLNFYKMIRYIEKGRINLDTTMNREMLKDIFDYDKKQVEAYDYTFYV